MSFEKYCNAEKKINEGLIRLGLSIERGEAKPRDPNARMAEMGRFLKTCGDPQKGIPAIHVAGTSGKGSVAAAIAGILSQAGLKVGLHVSPYLQSATEKLWVNEQFVSSDQFADLVDWVMPVATPRVHPDTHASIHGMASVAIAFEAFRREKVDVMVFEAGCGGRYDLTSFMDTTVSVVTNVGMDHVISLGPTLEDIAWHKAGVARAGVPMVTGAEGSALDVIAKECESVGAHLIRIPRPPSALDHNRAVAAEAARQFAHRTGHALDEQTILAGLDRVRLAGRFERMPGTGPMTIIDGAHNAEKLTVAVQVALQAPPLQAPPPGPKVAVIGFLGTKANPHVTAPLAGKFDHVIATEPAVYAKASCPAATTAELLAIHGYTPLVETDMHRAVDQAIDLAGPDGMVFISGSFYLVGEIRGRWYPTEDVVTQRTSWPAHKNA